ncbi:hypothetical protein E2C01_069890 [Portunus trituberculatus]|uniref:Uncharacterized protein n=1 Tax=Portunus trituberculatus TaxID=210409 RepID=A0A5B7HSR9_PORTR|nr:hypothetical protein [Portunus trituberculatus]
MRGPFGVRGLTSWQWPGSGVWRVFAHSDPCGALRGCIVTALTPTRLLGWTFGEEGFVLVPV